MAKRKFIVVAINETHNWAEGLLESHGLEAAFGLYLVCTDERTHCCEITPSYRMDFLNNAFVYDTDDEAAHEAAGELAFEGGADTIYMHCHTVDGMDARFKTTPEVVELRRKDYDSADEWREAFWTEAREGQQSSPDEPDILWSDYHAWQDEQRAKRRAENRPVIGGARDGTQLPLFTHAWAEAQAVHPEWARGMDGYREEMAALVALGWHHGAGTPGI